LFYVVSAFSLFLSYKQRSAVGPFSYPAYFVRRLARIAPMFWLAIALNLAISGLAPRYWAPDGVTWSDVALTALFLNGLKPDAITSVVPGGWSIAVETTFYLLLPLFFVGVRSLRAALAVFAICLFVGTAACAWYFQAHYADYTDANRYILYSFAWLLWLPAQLPVFALGIVLYFMREKLPAVPGLGACWFAFAVALLAVSLYLPSDGLMRNYLIASLGFVFLCMAAMNGDMTLLDNAFLRLVGKISFSIYLLHFAVLTVGHKLNERFFHVTETGNLKFIAALAIVVPACIGVSYLTYRFVELPGMRLSGRLARALDAETGALAGR
jgi:peptidoglycan/LPS O-acetylase OafA/YrhL